MVESNGAIFGTGNMDTKLSYFTKLKGSTGKQLSPSFPAIYPEDFGCGDRLIPIPSFLLHPEGT
jgi:hypothetical protein